jgi:hypothetical protein
MNSYNDGLEECKKLIEEEFVNDSIEYESYTYVYERVVITNNQEDRNYYYEVKFKVDNEEEIRYFSYKNKQISNISKEEYDDIYNLVNSGKVSGRIVNL